MQKYAAPLAVAAACIAVLAEFLQTDNPMIMVATGAILLLAAIVLRKKE